MLTTDIGVVVEGTTAIFVVIPVFKSVNKNIKVSEKSH
jgi:hypothetical protein